MVDRSDKEEWNAYMREWREKNSEKIKAQREAIKKFKLENGLIRKKLTEEERKVRQKESMRKHLKKKKQLKRGN